MTLSNVFRIIGSVFLIFAIIDRFTPSYADDNLNIYKEKAVNFMVQKLFANSFREVTVPSTDSVAKGSLLYNQRKEKGFVEIGKAGMIIDLPFDKLQTLVDLWQRIDIVSKDSANNMRNIMKKSNFKTIVDYVHPLANGDIVYTIFGFVETKKSGSRSGTVLYSLRKFKLQTKADITSRMPSTNDVRCKLWGQFCPRYFKVNALSDSESENLFNYIRAETVKSFVSETGPYFDYLGKESQHYQKFLPKAFSDNLRKLEDNPGKLPTEVFGEDPFTIDKY